MNTHEAVCDRDRIAASEWRKSAIAILEEIKASNALSHDQMRRDFREFMETQARTNADLYERINQGSVDRASDRGKIVGASGVLALVITILTTLLSSLIGWPTHR